MKLQNKIFLANLLVVLLALAGFCLIINQMFHSYFMEETKLNLEREQQLVTQSLDTVFNSVQDYIRLAALNTGLQDAMRSLVATTENPEYSMARLRVSREMGDILSNFLYPVTHVVGGAVVVDGSVIYSGYDIRQEYAQEIISEAFLNEIAEERRPVWSGMTELTYNTGERKRVMMVGMAILHKDTGQYLGECIFFVDESVLANTFTSDQYLNSHLYLVDEAGQVVSCADKELLGQPIWSIIPMDRNQWQEDLFQEIVSFGDSDTDVYSITEYPRMDWRIVNTSSYETAAEKNTDTIAMTLATGVACVVLVFIVSYLISFTIIRPINSIAARMARASGGDLSVRETNTYSGEIQVIASGFNTLMDKTQTLLDETYRQQKQRRENEFKILQSQINPHFLYNTIETIISLITLDMKKEATATAMSLASFYKHSLSSGRSMISIAEELKIAQNYLSIQKLRYEDYFDYTFQVSGVEQYRIPKLTLQPLIENAIYHGIKEREAPGPGRICISGGLRDGLVVLEVYDNGAGIEPERLAVLLTEETVPHGSFGLINVDQRIKYKYGKQFGLNIESVCGEFTRVTVTLPPDLNGTGGTL